MWKFSTLRLWIAIIVIPVMTLIMSIQPIAAQQDRENGSDSVCAELQNEMAYDQELAELVAMYVKLLHNQALSADELAMLIAREENEKARLLGIKISQNSYRAESELLQLCYAPLWRPGRVVWNFPNPGQFGARYSVKPEFVDNNLDWAIIPVQEIDGIYRDHPAWGNCRAYKIPDGSTATFDSAESWEECYNAAACHVGGICPGWVNPCNLPGWPNQPLR